MKRAPKQLDLRLSTGSWGGRRRGSGRRPGPSPRIRYRPRGLPDRSSPSHVTLEVRTDVPSLRSVRLVRELERSFSLGCSRRGFRLVHYSIQRDHAHFVVEASGRAALGRGMIGLAARFSRATNRLFGRASAVLRDPYHVRALSSPCEVRNALRYVLLNHRKHSRGRSRHAGSDPASSGRFFDGWKELRPSDGTRRPVARARTWLLTVGWRRPGPIGLRELPGATP